MKQVSPERSLVSELRPMASELPFYRLSCCGGSWLPALESESGRMVSGIYLEDVFLSKKLLCAGAVGVGCPPIHSDCALHIRKLGGRNLDAFATQK